MYSKTILCTEIISDYADVELGGFNCDLILIRKFAYQNYQNIITPNLITNTITNISANFSQMRLLINIYHIPN